jgi:pyruvate dehydrogenase E2 component (dihydrolipoamide acetyltransferase)
MFGVEEFVPIINPPECAILAAGAIMPSFCLDAAGNSVWKKMMKITLVFDHRIVDGAPAARFLRDLKNLIERPEMILE